MLELFGPVLASKSVTAVGSVRPKIQMDVRSGIDADSSYDFQGVEATVKVKVDRAFLAAGTAVPVFKYADETVVQLLDDASDPSEALELPEALSSGTVQNDLAQRDLRLLATQLVDLNSRQAYVVGADVSPLQVELNVEVLSGTDVALGVPTAQPLKLNAPSNAVCSIGDMSDLAEHEVEFNVRSGAVATAVGLAKAPSSILVEDSATFNMSASALEAEATLVFDGPGEVKCTHAEALGAGSIAHDGPTTVSLIFNGDGSVERTFTGVTGPVVLDAQAHQVSVPLSVQNVSLRSDVDGAFDVLLQQ